MSGAYLGRSRKPKSRRRDGATEVFRRNRHNPEFFRVRMVAAERRGKIDAALKADLPALLAREPAADAALELGISERTYSGVMTGEHLPNIQNAVMMSGKPYILAFWIQLMALSQYTDEGKALATKLIELLQAEGFL